MPLRDPLPDHPRVAVLGLGVSGVAATRLLHQCGKSVLAIDGRRDSAPELPDGVEVQLGSHDIRDCTAAVLSPSLNPEWPENQQKSDLAPLFAASERGEVKLLSEIALAGAAFTRPLLVVGGTDGKSTTVSILHHLLDTLGVDCFLGGNSWTSLSEQVLERPDATVGVAEVSAFQLWEPHGFKPATAVLTNVAADHLDHYAGMDAYAAAKKHLLRNLDTSSRAVLWHADARLNAWGRGCADAGIRVGWYDDGARPDGERGAWFDGTHLHVESDDVSLRVRRNALVQPGAHNARNALAALLAIAMTPETRGSLDDAAAVEHALTTFRGLPHRVEFVRELDGVRYYDDSKATNVHAAVTGLRAFDPGLTVITGGVDKGLNMAPLIDTFVALDARVIIIGELRDRLTRECEGRVATESAASLEAAVARAHFVTETGSVVLLSPAASSFDMFRSFEERGQRYQEAVRALT